MDQAETHSCNHCQQLLLDFHQYKWLWRDFVHRAFPTRWYRSYDIPTNIRLRDLENGAMMGCSLFAQVLAGSKDHRNFESRSTILLEAFYEAEIGFSKFCVGIDSSRFNGIKFSGHRTILQTPWRIDSIREPFSPVIHFLFSFEGCILYCLVIVVGLICLSLTDNPANQQARQRLPNLQPGSEASLNTARMWLQQCRKNHPSCFAPPLM
jgi:hypothetical protein